MTNEQFVDAIRQCVADSSVSSILAHLQSPTGTKPAAWIIKCSGWYNSQPEESQEMVNEIVRQSVSEAVFGMLCVLDNVRVIKNERDARLDLFFVDSTGRTLLNDFCSEGLHDIFNDNA